jgi:hypothetical protein
MITALAGETDRERGQREQADAGQQHPFAPEHVGQSPAE